MAQWEFVGRIKAAANSFRLVLAGRCPEPTCVDEQRLADLLSAAPAVIYACRWDDERATTFISTNILRLSGYPPEKFLRHANFWRSIIHPDDRQRVQAEWSCLPERGQAAVEYRFHHRNGEWRWARDEVRLVRNCAGQPMEMVGSWIDITDRRVSEEALAVSEAQLRATQQLLTNALESSDDAFSLFDADDQLLLFNSRYRTLYPTIANLIQPGVTFTDLLRTSALRGQYLGVGPEQADEWVRQRLSRHDAATGTFEQKLTDGRCLEIVERRTAEGNRVAIRRDVTARKRIEEALRQELAFEQTLIDALPFPVFFMGLDQRYLGCNTKFAEALGRHMAEIIGSTPHDLITPEQAEECAVLGSELFNAASVQNYEATMRWADGSYRRLKIFKGSFKGGDGKVAGFIGSLIDITPQKRAEEQLVQAAKLATLGQIASEVAHELNQPLSIIRMSAESCLPGGGDGAMSPDRLERKMRTVSDQVTRMAEMVDHLRSFSRIDGGPKRPFAPAPVVNSATRLLSPHFQLDGIALLCEVDAACPDIRGQPNQVEQVVLNLLANARDAVRSHCPAGQGRVEVKLQARDDWAHLTVQDNGGGIPERLWQNIFEPFFTTKAEGAGTGLGLSISANIVSGMGGRISGHNAEGGACFTVSLPLHRAAEAVAMPDCPLPAAQPAAAPLAGPRGRVLVVDDEAVAVECIAEFLQNLGFDVLTATDPMAALELAHDTRIHLLVTDMRMPGMGGRALLDRLRNRMPSLPAVLMTGGPLPSDPPADGVVMLRKPLALAELAKEIQRLLAVEDTPCG